ncbi:MAG: hypothetical protein V4550_08740 [Gemmatimonadota bacterium]
MPNHDEDPRDREWLTEDAAHRLLARAVELDSRAASEISLAQLREVAAEVGVSSEAFDRALQELQGRPATDDSAVGQRRTTLLGVLTRYRRHAAVLMFAGAAIATRGDVLVLNLIYAAPLLALYELAILLLRRGDGDGNGNGDGRQSTSTLHASADVGSGLPRRDTPNRLMRNLALKAAFAPRFT